MRWLTEMGVFARVVDQGNFGKAAHQLGMTRSAVSKHVSRLETGLGVKLLHRTTRAMSLTDAGVAVYEQCARLIAAAEEAEAAAARLLATPRGRLKLSATVAYGHAVLTPRLAAFLERYPELTVELDLLDRNVDLAEEGYDLVLRLTDQPPERLAARKLAEIEHVLCASPAYRDRHGHPSTPGDLAAHNCLRHGQPAAPAEWHFDRDGESTRVKINGNVIVSSNLTARALTLAGVGCSLLPDFLVRAHLASGRLVRLLPDYRPRGPFAAVYALYLPNRHASPKVRAFIDWLIEVLNGQEQESAETGMAIAIGAAGESRA